MLPRLEKSKISKVGLGDVIFSSGLQVPLLVIWRLNKYGDVIETDEAECAFNQPGSLSTGCQRKMKTEKQGLGKYFFLQTIFSEEIEDA